MLWVTKIIRSGRLFVILGVCTSFIAALVLSVVTFLSFLMKMYEFVHHGIALDDDSIKELAVSLMNYVDLFFIATAFVLISAGFYKLFIDESLKLPAAISINSFDDLKKILIRVAIVVLTILFLEKAIRWQGGWEITGFGFACAFVIIAITFNIRSSDDKTGTHKNNIRQDPS